MDSGGFFVDEKAVNVERLFLSFLQRYPGLGDPFYVSEVEKMRPNESTTMFIDFSHLMQFDDTLQKAISDEFIR